MTPLYFRIVCAKILPQGGDCELPGGSEGPFDLVLHDSAGGWERGKVIPNLVELPRLSNGESPAGMLNNSPNRGILGKPSIIHDSRPKLIN